MSSSRRPKHLILAFCLAIAAALFAASTGQAAQPQLQCRSDPLVVLSDGTVLDISADISAMLWRIKRVHYTLYIPAGLKVVTKQSTPNWPTTTERFTIYATNPAGKFTATVMVLTQEANVPVKANFSINTTFLSKQGMSGQALTLKIRR